MSSFEDIQKKLERFIRKFYTNELLRGAILFFAFGLLYLLVTLLIEYFFWLSPPGRTVLFWLFIAVEVVLLGKFIILPIARLLKLTQGINFRDAAHIIGDHFPEVSDKLLNILELHNATTSSELLQASIEQKSGLLRPIPFSLAINFQKNIRYLKYAAIPIVIFLLVNYLGKGAVFSTSFERVVNYNEAYEAPAPFMFFVINKNLEAIQGKDYELRVRTVGDVVPEEVYIRFNDESYLLQQIVPGEYSHTFDQLDEDTVFSLQGNNIVSKPYTLQVLEVPVLVDFEMGLDYPRYTGKPNDIVKNTGNAIIPEGTKVSWKLKTRTTKGVDLVLNDTIFPFALSETRIGSETFVTSKHIYTSMSYEVSTSNEVLRNYENLSYTLQVIKDQYPQMSVEVKKDTVTGQQNYFFGRLSDDYGLHKLQLVYYPVNSTAKVFKSIPISNGTIDQFLYAFPDDLVLEEGVNYEYYFEVFDNDAIHRFKSTKSRLFSFLKRSQDEIENVQLERQEKTIENLDASLQKMKEREKELQAIAKTQKEKEQLSFNDQRKLENFLKRQEQQENLMKDFSEQLKENLDEFQKDNPLTDAAKEKLRDRLERQEKKARENERLLKELQELREKMTKEELSQKLDKLEKQNKNNTRNLEQMVELTKRYYVQKKAEKIANDIQRLAEKQEKLSRKSGADNTSKEQDELNSEFKSLEDELSELEKENKELKKPMDLPGDAKKQEEIKEEQQGASEELERQEDHEKETGQPQDKSGAQQKQKKAAEKMKQLGQAMSNQMQGSGEEALEEDVEMLRQILDNLLIFSIEEEGLMEDFSEMTDKSPTYANRLRRQSQLKQNLMHIDDSLYALSLRQPRLDEIINETLLDIDYNIEQALKRLAENQVIQGVSSQQYVVTGANALADVLSETLDNMQSAMMSGKGSGKGKGIGMGQGSVSGEQLPDIIQSQEELNSMMKDGEKSGYDGEGEGKEGEKSGYADGSGSQGGDSDRGKGKGSGEGQGQSGEEGALGQGEGSNEAEGEEYAQGLLFEIYKQQSKLRQQLQDAIEREGLGDVAERLVRQMEGVERDLLEKGFNNQTLERMLNLKHQLLELNDAALKQGQEEKRESNTNLREYSNNAITVFETARKYFNTSEILNRNALPLKEIYKVKVQTYFRKENDSIQ